MIEQIKEWGELALVLVGVLAVAVAGLKRIYKAVKWVEEIHSTIQRVEHELHPNSGSTLRETSNARARSVRSNAFGSRSAGRATFSTSSASSRFVRSS